MNITGIATIVAILMESLLGIAYLGYSAYLLSFERLPYTVCGILIFLYVFTSIGSFGTSVRSIFDTAVNEKRP